MQAIRNTQYMHGNIGKLFYGLNTMYLISLKKTKLNFIVNKILDIRSLMNHDGIMFI